MQIEKNFYLAQFVFKWFELSFYYLSIHVDLQNELLSLNGCSN